MNYIFKPRGIIKWHPFASVTDTIAIADVVDKMNNVQIRPNLSAEQMGEINAVLIEAIQQKAKVAITYFLENHFYFCEGHIQKYFKDQAMIQVDKKKISLSTIIDIYPLTEV